VNGGEVVQAVEGYPITPKEHGPDFLLSNRHLWLRSKKQWALMRVRDAVITAIRRFYDDRGFVCIDSPMFTPQQYYLIGYLQDSWRATDRLTLDMGLRYDFYSVVKEKDGLAKPFFVEDNAFSSDPDNFYNPDKNNFAPRFSAVYALDEKTAVRGGVGLFYGPGQFEDRIQPIENYIERRRAQAADVAANGLAYPFTGINLGSLLSVRGYTHERPDEYNLQYGGSVSRELPGAVNLTIGYTGSRGKDMFLRGVANTLSFATRVREVPSVGQVDYKTSGCLDGLVINGNTITGCGRASYDAL